MYSTGDFVFVTVFAALIVGMFVFFGFAISGSFDNHHTDPRTHAVKVSNDSNKVCAGKNLVTTADDSFWGNNIRVVSVALNSPECN